METSPAPLEEIPEIPAPRRESPQDIDDMIVSIHAIQGQIAPMGANGHELSRIEEIIDELRKGERTCESAFEETLHLLNSKQDYH